jgi:serine/threonine-protein kinase
MSILNLLRDPLPGLDLDGRYRILSKLGAGSVSDVYLGRQTRLGDRMVAVRVLKEIHCHRNSDSPGIHERRFLVEAQLFPLLKHPCFARIHDVGFTPTEEPRPYMIMEYLEGPRLLDAVATKPLPWEEALLLGATLASALEELHALGVVLRDLSPANVILEEVSGLGRLPKLFDFSHAVADAIPELGTGSEDSLFVGSAPYSAPELASGRSDHRADLFSLGALLHLAASGQAPWSGNLWPRQTAGLILPQTPLGKLVPGSPRDLESLLAACLSPNPQERPKSAAQLAEKLLDLWFQKGARGKAPKGLGALLRFRLGRPASR